MSEAAIVRCDGCQGTIDLDNAAEYGVAIVLELGRKHESWLGDAFLQPGRRDFHGVECLLTWVNANYRAPSSEGGD